VYFGINLDNLNGLKIRPTKLSSGGKFFWKFDETVALLRSLFLTGKFQDSTKTAAETLFELKSKTFGTDWHFDDFKERVSKKIEYLRREDIISKNSEAQNILKFDDSSFLQKLNM